MPGLWVSLGWGRTWGMGKKETGGEGKAKRNPKSFPQRIPGIWEEAEQTVGNNEMNKGLSPSIARGSWEKCQVTAGPQWQAQRVSGGIA